MGVTSRTPLDGIGTKNEHSAMDASVEQLLQSALRGRPVAVGGGVVLAAS